MRVRISATKKEITLISRAARKLGLTPSQFVARTARNFHKKAKSVKASIRAGSLQKRQPPRQKRSS